MEKSYFLIFPFFYIIIIYECFKITLYILGLLFFYIRTGGWWIMSYFLITTVITICFIYILLFSIINIFHKQGFKFPLFLEKLLTKNNLLLNNNSSLSKGKSVTIEKTEIIKVGLYALSLRLIFLLLSYISLHIFNDFSHILNLNEFLDELTEWDCNNYYRISEYGYNYWQENGYKTTLAFFPLYPFISYLLNFIIHNTKLSLLLVSIISYSIGCCYLYALITKELNKKIAKRTLIYISVFPFAFFFGTMMPESLFFLLICMTLYYINEHKFFIASITGFLAVTTRLQGILIIIPFIIELIINYKVLYVIKHKHWKELKEPLLKLLYIPIYFLGIIVYLLCNYLCTGNMFYFIILQEKIWNHHFAYPSVSIKYTIDSIPYIVNLNTKKIDVLFLTWIPQLLVFILCIFALIYGIGKINEKYSIYLLFYLFISYASSFLVSGGRYMSIAVPMFIILAISTREHPFIDKCYTALSFSFCVLFNICYILSKHIV